MCYKVFFIDFDLILLNFVIYAVFSQIFIAKNHTHLGVKLFSSNLVSIKNMTFRKSGHIYQTSLLHKLQTHTLPGATTLTGKIHTFSKMTVTFESMMGFEMP